MPDRPPLAWHELQALTDEVLLALARERRGGGPGDRETVDRCAVVLLGRHRTAIRSLCARRAPSHAVDDIQGDVRERLAGVLRGGEPVANVGGLVTTLCRRAVADWHERRRRHADPAAPAREEAADDAGFGEVEVRELAHELLAGLSDRSRRAVEATYLEDRPAGEVAAELGVTANNLYQIVHRALADMREAAT